MTLLLGFFGFTRGEEEEEQEGLKTGLCCCLLGSKFSRFLDRDLRGVGDDATAAIGKVGVL